MNTGYQPYGQAGSDYVRRNFPQLRQFGITYIAVRSVILGLAILAILFLTSLLPTSMIDSNVGAAILLVIMIPLVWLGFAIAGGVLAMKGNVAGAYMGLVDAGGSTLLSLWSMVDGGVGGGLCLIGTNILIAVLGIKAVQEVNAGGIQGQVAQMNPQANGAYNTPQQYAAPQQYGAPQQHSSPQPHGAPQQPAPQQPAQAQPAQQPQGAYLTGAAPQQQPAPQQPPAQQPPASQGHSTQAPSPKAAALGVLQLAASLDPDHGKEALHRARSAALNLLGPTGAPRVKRQLAGLTRVVDLDHDLWRYCAVLREQASDKLKTQIIESAKAVLKSPHGELAMSEQFITTLKYQLGVA